MISVESKGSFTKTEDFLLTVKNGAIFERLRRYGQEGVEALAQATPIDSGETASQWDYQIRQTKKAWVITWVNNNIVDGVPIAVLIQYGHGTKTGGYVQGRDYVNPAIQPVFDRIAADVWKEVTSA